LCIPEGLLDQIIVAPAADDLAQHRGAADGDVELRADRALASGQIRRSFEKTPLPQSSGKCEVALPDQIAAASPGSVLARR